MPHTISGQDRVLEVGTNMVPSPCSMKGRSDNLGKKQYVDHGRLIEGEPDHLSTWKPGISLLNEGMWVWILRV